MDTLLITGAGGLVGSAAAEHFHSRGLSIIGVDNDLRGRLLGDPDASTRWNVRRLERSLKNFVNHDVDVRDAEKLERIVKERASSIRAIIHTAAQPAHEGEVMEDFSINAVGTLGLLSLWRRYCPSATFIYTSTIKVYGNFPNTLEYLKVGTQYDLSPGHRFYRGFDESVSIDQGISSFFGRSKTTSDLYVQEYAYQFGLRAVCFRPSCVTGGHHAGAEAHGMLSYLMRCAVTGKPYRIFGYDGLQVRDQLSAADLVRAFEEVLAVPPKNVVYNIGGGRENACSILQAIAKCEELAERKLQVSHHEMRKGDHIWWVTDNRRLESDYPNWRISCPLDAIFRDIYENGRLQWKA